MLCACCHGTADLIKIKLCELKEFSLLFSCDIGFIYLVISGQQSNVSCDLKKQRKTNQIELVITGKLRTCLIRGCSGLQSPEAQDPELLGKRCHLNPF